MEGFTIGLFILAALPVISALPYNIFGKAVTITTTDAHFNVGTYTAHGLHKAPTLTARRELKPSPPAPLAVPYGRVGHVAFVSGAKDAWQRAASLPDFTVHSKIRSEGCSGILPSIGPELEKQVAGRCTEARVIPPRGWSKSGPVGLVQQGESGGVRRMQLLEKGCHELEPLPHLGGLINIAKRSKPYPQRGGDLDETLSAGIENSSEEVAENQALGEPTLTTIGSSTQLTASTPTATQAVVWSPQVIATSLALIPVILAITVICCLILFMILHCCTPREITHVTNNTYTTKVVRRHPRDAEKSRPVLTGGPPHCESANEIAHPEPAAIAQQNDGLIDVSPSSYLYLPHYPRHHAVVFHSAQSSPPQETNWHRGLLGFGSRKSSIQSSFLRPFVPPSLLGSNAETSYVLSQASKRLEEEAPNHPLSTVPASPLSESPVPRGLSPAPEIPAPPQSERKTSLSSGLQDTGCGTHTLRNRRKGMRDSWLSNLFVERAPGTENLVVLEQRDGAIRGASVGGAVEPETVQISESSSSPRRPNYKTPDKPSRKRVLSTRKLNKATHWVDIVQAKSSNREKPKPHTVPRIKLIQRYSREINPKNARVLSGDVIIPEGQSPVSSLGYEGSHSDSKDLEDASSELRMGKENINTDRHAQIRRTPENPATNRVEGRFIETDHTDLPLALPNNTDGSADLMSFQARAQRIEEEINKRLQEAIDDQIDQDELRLHMVASLDGVANSPKNPGSIWLTPGWGNDDGIWSSDHADSAATSGNYVISVVSSQKSSARTSELGETFMDERDSTTTLGALLSID